MITVTSDDARANMVIDPGWYIVDIVDVYTKPAGTDKSTNVMIKMIVVSTEQGDKKFEGVSLKEYLMNEKSFRFHFPFLKAMGVPQEVINKLESRQMQNLNIDENEFRGKRIKAAVKTTEYNGRKSNEAFDFLPAATKVA